MAYDKDIDAYTVRFVNTGGEPVGIPRWYVLYEIRLLDADGKQLSDFDGYLSDTNIRIPGEGEWTVLWPGDVLEIHASPYNRIGPVRTPLEDARRNNLLPTATPTAKTALLVFRSASMKSVRKPSHFKSMGVKPLTSLAPTEVRL